MNFNNYTQKSIEAVQSAQQLAVQNSHQQMEQVHLLLALLQQEGGLIPQLLLCQRRRAGRVQCGGAAGADHEG